MASVLEHKKGFSVLPLYKHSGYKWPVIILGDDKKSNKFYHHSEIEEGHRWYCCADKCSAAIKTDKDIEAIPWIWDYGYDDMVNKLKNQQHSHEEPTWTQTKDFHKQ